MARRIAIVVALAFAAGDAGIAAAGDAPGVTDFSGASASAIQTDDILEALSVPRGAHIQATAPPTVRLPIYFEFNSTQLEPGASELLDKVGAALASNELQTFSFSVEGHTDSIGSADYNQELSQRRAEVVMQYLVAKGVSEDRLQVVGHGESEPVADNDTDAGRQRNRRVELINLGSAKP